MSPPSPRFEFHLDDDGVSVVTFGRVMTEERIELQRFLEAWNLGHNPATRGSGLINPALRYVSADRTRVLFERPPVTVPLWFYGGRAVEGKGMLHAKEYRIPLPWQVYGIEFTSESYEYVNSVRVWARPDRISASTDPLYLLPLPNMDGITGHACQGTTAYSEYPEPPAGLGPAIDRVLSTFWTSHFNEDIQGWHADTRLPLNASDYAHPHPGFKFLRWWAGHSLTDVMGWDWRPCAWLGQPTTVGQIMDYFDGLAGPEPVHSRVLLTELLQAALLAQQFHT